MTWLYFKYDGLPLRIDSVNCLLLQRWREHNIKGGDWEECNIYKLKSGISYINIGGRTATMEMIVYQAHNPKWSNHYSRHNIVMYINGDIEDYSIENLMIKPTGGVRRY